MNEVKITGRFERGIETKTVEREGGRQVQLAMGSFTFKVKRGSQEIPNWIDVEVTGDKHLDMLDIPLNFDVTLTGQLRRAAWKNKQDEWEGRHFLLYESHEAEGFVEQPGPDPTDVPLPIEPDDIPF